MKKLILLFTIALITSTSFGQEGSISGKITDAEAQFLPLEYAYIKLLETQQVTNADLNGNFEFEHLEPGIYMMSVSYPGYTTKKVKVKVERENTTEVNLRLTKLTLDPSTFSSISEVGNRKD